MPEPSRSCRESHLLNSCTRNDAVKCHLFAHFAYLTYSVLLSLVVALDGFYEWKTLADGKQPYYITPNDDSCMYFAALWDAYSTKDGVLHTCTILSRESSDQMKWLHDRQPITLSEEAIEQWIDSAIHPLQILATTNDLFTTCPPRLVFTPVSRCMNKISYQQSDCTTMVEFDEIPKSSVARFFVMESGKASNMETLPSTPNRSPATNGMKRKLDSGSSQKSKTVGGAKSPSRQLSMDAFISR